ncbi:MAG: MGMT family protein [Candidatus Omnitrophota bacterium]
MGNKNSYKEQIAANPRFTKFMKKVLFAVLDIPEGEVRPYAWVAQKSGYPGAARAVGQVLKKNPYAPHVPCHRVVRSDGSIGGYSGGLEKKRALLKKEGLENEADRYTLPS